MIRRLINKIPLVIIEFFRLLLGGVFIYSGFVKAIDPIGFSIKIKDYLSAFGLSFLDSFSTAAAINLCAIEFMLGVSVLLGAYRKYSTSLVLIFMACITPLTLYLALFNPVADCGCFGDAIILSNWATFGKNLVLISLAFIIYINNQRLFAFYSYKTIWFVSFFSFASCAFFAYNNHEHLPPIDFRPFKKGTNIIKAMSFPKEAESDQYEYTFIYKKDGVKKTFTIDNYPKDDTTWTFIDTKAKLIKKGYHPAIESFNLYDTENEDITQKILTDTTSTFLLIIPNVKEANDQNIDRINQAFDYANEQNLKFYAVIGSDPKTFDHWKNYTGAEYSFLQADETLLKTMIRSNPGLILLKKGIIINKWHYNDIPDNNKFETFKKDDSLKLGYILTFSVPLLLVLLYDVFVYRKRHKREQIEIK